VGRGCSLAAAADQARSSPSCKDSEAAEALQLERMGLRRFDQRRVRKIVSIARVRVPEFRPLSELCSDAGAMKATTGTHTEWPCAETASSDRALARREQDPEGRKTALPRFFDQSGLGPRFVSSRGRAARRLPAVEDRLQDDIHRARPRRR